MLKKDPDERISISEMLQYEFLGLNQELINSTSFLIN